MILKVLENIGKELNDVIAIASDSASYMNKAIGELSNDNILHVNDVSHLIHNCIIEGFKVSEIQTLKAFI